MLEKIGEYFQLSKFNFKNIRHYKTNTNTNTRYKIIFKHGLNH